MVLSTTIYEGDKRCRITHDPSQSMIETDAPKDNHGAGARFSPTDLVGAALGACIVTTIAIVFEKDGLKLKSARAQVQKEMSASPRRIAKLAVQITMPSGVAMDMRPKIENLAHNCPVQKSLHPDMQLPIEFIYPD